MNIWENAVVTVKGLSLLSKLIEGDTLNITRAETGEGYVTPGLLNQLTAVSNPKQSLSIKTQSYPEEGKCKLPCYLTNAGLSAGYTAKQVGVYATDPDEGEILFLIVQSPSDKGTVVPSEAEMAGYSAEWNLYFQYGQASGVTVVVDPTDAVTRAELEVILAEAIKPVDAKLSATSENPVQNKAVTAGLNTKVDNNLFGVDAAWGVGDAYTASIPGFNRLYPGLKISIIPDATSETSTPTLNINGLGAVPMYWQMTGNTAEYSSPHDADWLRVGVPVELTYEAMDEAHPEGMWRVNKTIVRALDIDGVVSVAKGGTGKKSVTKDSVLVGNGSTMTEKTMDELAQIMSEKLFTCSTEDIVAGETPLASGKFYLVYE